MRTRKARDIKAAFMGMEPAVGWICTVTSRFDRCRARAIYRIVGTNRGICDACFELSARAAYVDVYGRNIKTKV